jgi:hypothetical protein
MKIEARLQERGIVLPQFRPMVSPKVVRYRKAGNLLFIDFRHIGSIQIDMPCADRINSGNAVEQRQKSMLKS